MLELTTKVSSEDSVRLVELEKRVNQKLAAAIQRGKTQPVTIEEIAMAVMQKGLLEVRVEGIIFRLRGTQKCQK